MSFLWIPSILPSILFPKPQNPKGIQKGSWDLDSSFESFCCLVCLDSNASFRSYGTRYAVLWNKMEWPGHAQKPLRVKLLDGKQQKQHRCCMPRSHCLKVCKVLQISRCKKVQMLLCPSKATIKLSNYIKFSWARKVLHWKWYRCVQSCSCKQAYSLTLLGWSQPLCGFKRSLKAVLAAVICLIERFVMTCLRDMFHAVSKRCFKTCW